MDCGKSKAVRNSGADFLLIGIAVSLPWGRTSATSDSQASGSLRRGSRPFGGTTSREVLMPSWRAAGSARAAGRCRDALGRCDADRAIEKGFFDPVSQAAGDTVAAGAIPTIRARELDLCRLSFVMHCTPGHYEHRHRCATTGSKFLHRTRRRQPGDQGILLPTPTSGAAAGIVNGVPTVTGGESSGETRWSLSFKSYVGSPGARNR